MANCFEIIECNELATIKYMRNLIPSSIGSCTSVSAGTVIPTTCGGNPLEENYIPKYSELDNETFAPKRVTNDSDPSQDVNGFIISAPTLVSSSCGSVAQDDEALMKSQISFGATSASSVSHNNISMPSACNTSWSLDIVKTWGRVTYSCNNGSITPSTQSITKNESNSGELSKSYSPSFSSGSTSAKTTWDVSFDSHVETTTISDRCGGTASTSTTFSVNSYNISGLVEWPSGMVPCNPGTAKIDFTISNGDCPDEMQLEVTASTIDGITAGTIISNTTSINIGRNERNVTREEMTIVPIVNGSRKSGDEFTVEIQRGTCGYSSIPSFYGCSPFATIENTWENLPDQEEHPY